MDIFIALIPVLVVVGIAALVLLKNWHSDPV